MTGNDDHLAAVGHELRVDRSEIFPLAEVEGLRYLREIHSRINVREWRLRVSITGELTIWQRCLLVFGCEDVNAAVRRIECEHVLTVRRREDLKRDAGGGGGYKVKVKGW